MLRTFNLKHGPWPARENSLSAPREMSRSARLGDELRAAHGEGVFVGWDFWAQPVRHRGAQPVPETGPRRDGEYEELPEQGEEQERPAREWLRHLQAGGYLPHSFEVADL